MNCYRSNTEAGDKFNNCIHLQEAGGGRCQNWSSSGCALEVELYSWKKNKVTRNKNKSNNKLRKKHSCSMMTIIQGVSFV